LFVTCLEAERSDAVKIAAIRSCLMLALEVGSQYLSSHVVS
jgi:hypothetical protein